ncbi:MAG TPA: S8 family serine peptidase [Actinoallomurus sp.]|nr:S8 family serine peptidase [Actinoallomurus sp.]
MLIRRSAGLLATALLIGLTPPLTGESRAGTSDWLLRFTGDFIAAQRVSQGKSVKIALLADGVAPGVKTLRGRLEKEKDLVGTPRPKRVVGTLMASLIAGGAPTAGSFAGVLGLAPKATILSVRVYAEANEPGGRTWRDSADWGQNLAKGIRYAVDHGADVIAVNAYATGSETSELSTAIAYAQTKKAVVVATTGIQQPDNPVYPVSAPGVIGVGTVTQKGLRDKKTTSRSSDTLVSAPDSTTLSIGPDNRLWTLGGEPLALAFTTAAVALVRSEYPRLTPAQVGQALSASARRPKGKGRYDTELGFGYLNAVGALEEARKLAPQDAPAMTAKSSVPDSARLGGEKPGTIRAAPYDPLWIGGFGGLAFAGLVALGFAAWLALRKRSAPLPAPALPSEPADTTGT